ncbi:unnamed protein product [Clonostachys byssicola]|uniref:Uncharacterized protein n=1 Tax=Clonostachys byssicola TaxID=160290 RepID=A0A9N9UV33_9HYPO|nr:unnamed protein product [Clonostachys byssicola]
MGPAPASILDLSPEILVQILEYLCPHCSGEVKGTDTRSLGTRDSRLVEASQSNLHGLSTSCRKLRNIAQPCLYHYIVQTENARLIARTLLQRPSLAQTVEGLSITALDFNGEDDETLSDEDLATLELQMQTVSTDALENDTFERENILGMLMLGHTPNIQKLSVLTDSFIPMMYYPDGALSCLTILRANCDDTENGFGLSALAGIMRAAPNLKTFVASNLVKVSLEEGEIFSESVTEVNIAEAAIWKEDFDMLIQGFPSLQVFRFETGGDRANYIWCASPADMAKSLLARKETLKKLNLSVSAEFFPDGKLERGDMIDDLSRMTALESITLNIDSIYTEFGADFYDSDSDDDFYEYGPSLIDLLPESVRVLGIVEPSDVEDGIMELAASAPERFPLLRKVMLQYVNDNMYMAFKKAFKKAGIKCVKSKRLDLIVHA